MIRRSLFVFSMLAFLTPLAYAASLDGKTFDVEFQADSPTKGTIEFQNGMIVSPIHKIIQDKENEMTGAKGMQAPPPPAGVSYSEQESGEGVNFSGRTESFSPIYWSGWVRGEEIEGTINVESFDGPYAIPFKGKQA